VEKPAGFLKLKGLLPFSLLPSARSTLCSPGGSISLPPRRRNPERMDGSPRLRFASWCGRCLRHQQRVAMNFTRGLPPCGSCVLTSHFSLLTSHFSLLTSHFSLPRSPLLSTSYALLSRAAPFARQLPPNGLDFLLFQMFWSTRFPFTRSASNIKGVRSLSIGRLSPGTLQVIRWPRGYAPLSGNRHPAIVFLAFWR
jgi:hypothetical protein